jgi:uncharacterized membrane protein
MSNIESEVWYIMHPSIYVMKCMAWLIAIWRRDHLVNNNHCNIINT